MSMEPNVTLKGTLLPVIHRITLITAMLVIILSLTAQAQVGINTDGSSPDPSAMLDVKANNKGLLFPRLTSAQRTTLGSTAAAGLVVYDSDAKKLYYHDGAAWVDISIGNLWSRSGSNTWLTNTGDNVAIGTTTPGLIAGAARYLTISTPGLGVSNQISSIELKGSSGTTFLPVNRIDFLSQSLSNVNNIARIESRITNSQAEGELLFYTKGTDLTERMRIDEDGYVGIGNSNPTGPLHITSGQSGSTSSVAFVENTYSGTDNWVYAIQGRVNNSAPASGPGIGVLGMSTNATGGGVGVYGQTNGATGVAIRGSSLSSTGVNYGILASTNSSDGYAGYFSGGRNYFSGHVGIGTNSPAQPLHVIANQSTTASSVALVENSYTGTNSWVYAIQGKVNSSSSSGGPGIGVLGVSSNSTGGGVGLFGQTSGASGTGVKAVSLSATGTNYGVYATISSPDGFAGYFSGGKNYFSGSVGIGVSSPLGKLHVHDAVNSNNILYITPKNTASGDSATVFFAEDNDAAFGMYWMYDGNDNQMELWGKNNTLKYGPHMLINRADGNIAFGTAFASGYKLSVGGKIACTEVLVQATASWPDYVFKANYNLMSLDKLEETIGNTGHLPGMPSAKEVEKNGIQMGEMQRLIVQKVEELTLYAIEQNKLIKQMKDELEALKAENASLRKNQGNK